MKEDRAGPPRFQSAACALLWISKGYGEKNDSL